MSEVSWKTFVWAVLLGMGFHVGWGLISLIVWAMAKAVGTDGPALLH